MTLRTRLLLGYALLVLLLLVTGAAGTYEFREISMLVNDRLARFTATTTSANALLRSVDRQERALLQALVAAAPHAHAVDALDEAHEEFRRALAQAGQLADAEQRALLARIRDAEPGFLAARDRVLAPPDGTRAPPAEEYETVFLPAFERLREPCDALFARSRGQMFDARDAVRDAANGGSVLLGVLVTVGLLSLIAVARSMRTNVLERLDELRRFSEAIAAGEQHQRALVGGHDELGRLAAQMNLMLDQRSALEGRLEGRLAQDRHMLVGMLGSFGDGALLLSTAGDLITWSGRLPSPAVVDALALRAAERNRMIARGDAAPDAPLDWTGPDGSTWRVHPLRTASQLAAGWLVAPVATTA